MGNRRTKETRPKNTKNADSWIVHHSKTGVYRLCLLGMDYKTITMKFDSTKEDNPFVIAKDHDIIISL